MIKKATALWLSAIICLLTVGCSKKPAESLPTSSIPVPTTTTATTPLVPRLGLNPLTGEHDMETGNNRPVGYVVTDESSSLVQISLEKADLFFESETEAGIPRILAVFSSVDRIPDEIGPIRSARPHFVKIAKALDCIYGHVGGSTTGLETIRSLGVDDISGAEVTTSVLAASQNLSWNRKTFTAQKGKNIISTRRYRLTTSTASPYQFGEKDGDIPATTVTVGISENCKTQFTYSDGVYTKSRPYNTAATHTTYTGGPITVSNVIVMFDNRTFDEVYTNNRGSSTNRWNFDLNSGSGTLYSGGKGRSVCWRRTNQQLSFFESDGTTPLTVATGKTFIFLVSNTLQSRTTAQ